MLATTAEHTAAAELQPPATAGPPDAHHGGAASSSSVTELVASSGATDDATWDSLMELTRPNQIYKGTNEWDHREALCAAALVLDRCKVQGALGFGLSNRKILAAFGQPPTAAWKRALEVLRPHVSALEHLQIPQRVLTDTVRQLLVGGGSGRVAPPPVPAGFSLTTGDKVSPSASATAYSHSPLLHIRPSFHFTRYGTRRQAVGASLSASSRRAGASVACGSPSRPRLRIRRRRGRKRAVERKTCG